MQPTPRMQAFEVNGNNVDPLLNMSQKSEVDANITKMVWTRLLGHNCLMLKHQSIATKYCAKGFLKAFEF